MTGVINVETFKLSCKYAHYLIELGTHITNQETSHFTIIINFMHIYFKILIIYKEFNNCCRELRFPALTPENILTAIVEILISFLAKQLIISCQTIPSLNLPLLTMSKRPTDAHHVAGAMVGRKSVRRGVDI